MNVRIRKPKKSKRKKKPAKKVFKSVAPGRRPSKRLVEEESRVERLVTMTEFTNHQDESSTIYVCSSPIAALQKAIVGISTNPALTGLRDLTQAEVDQFLACVKRTDYGRALQIWNIAQERKRDTGAPWFSCELWSAAIHDEDSDESVLLAAEKAWRQRVATQSEASA